MKPHLALGLLALLAACSEDSGDGKADTAAQTPEELVRAMYVVVDEHAARPEHQAAEVTIQDLLVAVSGAGVPGVVRTPGEAEELTAELLARARAGEDFDLLVKNHTNDVHPGVYILAPQPSPDGRVYGREGVSAGLGDLAWRLEVGELGVVPYDGVLPGPQRKSPLGYHVVKRLK